MPRPDRKVADSLTPRTRRANTEKPRAKAVRRAAGALEAGRSPGGAPAVMKDQAGAPARKKGSGTQRQSTRWEPEPERKAFCPGQSATGMPPREWSKRRARAIHGRVPYARESAARQGGRQCPATERQPPKQPADGTRSIVSENALSDGGIHGQKKAPPQESGKSLGNKNTRRRLSPRQQRRAPENASDDGISVPLPDDATPPPDARQARVQRGQRA